MDNQLKEILDLISKAEKASKKSWFSSPDFSIAAQYYDQAAMKYKNLNYLPQSVETYIIAGESYSKTSAIFLAGKSYETAASLSLKLGDYSRYTELVELACKYYLASGSPDTAAQVYETGSKHLEPQDVRKATEFCQQGVNIYLSEDKGKHSLDGFRRLVYLYMKQEKWDETIEKIQEMRKVTDTLVNLSTSYKLLLTWCVLELNRGDLVAAKKVLDGHNSEVGGFASSVEGGLSEELIQHYQSQEPELYRQAVLKKATLFLDTFSAKLASKVKVAGGNKKRVETTITPNINYTEVGAVEPEAVVESDNESLC